MTQFGRSSSIKAEYQADVPRVMQRTRVDGNLKIIMFLWTLSYGYIVDKIIYLLHRMMIYKTASPSKINLFLGFDIQLYNDTN